MSRRTGSVATVALAATAVAGTSGFTSAGAAGSINEADEPRDCVVRDDADLRAAADPLRTSEQAQREAYDHQRWLADAREEALLSVQSELRLVLGVDEMESTAEERVRAGLIGTTTDHHAQEIVVVVDPSLVGVAATQAALRVEGLNVRVQASCYSAAELVRAGSTILDRSWHPQADKATFGVFLDPATSTIKAEFASEDREAGDALAARLGDVVDVSYSDDAGRRGRFDDGEPHWGGAAIGSTLNGSPSCTAGFTITWSGGGRGSVTAAHCYNNSDTLYSGPEYYGITEARQEFPKYDMIRITSGVETYDNFLHVDPCCPASREVVSDGDPAVNSFVCASGFSTLAVCGIQVKQLDAVFCDAFGCTKNLIFAEKPGGTAGAGGDSGAPVYNRWSNDRAAIRGMEIAGTAADNLYAHRISTVEARLGSVAHS